MNRLPTLLFLLFGACTAALGAPSALQELLAHRATTSRAASAPAASPPIVLPRGPAPAPPATPALSESALAGILQRLGNSDFAVREAAQNDLQRANTSDLPALLAVLRETQADAEVQTRLARCIEPLQDQAALNPPGITLHQRNVPAADLARALSLQLKMPVATIAMPANDPADHLTVELNNQPFWDVMQNLAAQGVTGIDIDYPGITLPRQFDRCGSFIAYIDATRGQWAHDISRLIGTPRAPSGFANPGILHVAADPRLPIWRAASPRILQAVDDRGNILLADETPSQLPSFTNDDFFFDRSPDALRDMGNWLPNFYATLIHRQTSTWLPLPENPGKTVTLRGETLFEIVVARDSVTLDNPLQNPGRPITVGDRSLLITDYSASDGRLFLLAKPADNADPASKPAGTPRIDIEILDARNICVYRFPLVMPTRLNVSLPPNVNAPRGTAPYRLVASVPTRTRLVLVPFELKNIPLPPMR